MSIAKEFDKYYEYGRLLWNNRSLIKQEENQTEYAIEDGDYDKTCEHMKEFIKLIERNKQFEKEKENQEEVIIKFIKKIVKKPIPDEEIKSCIQSENKLLIYLLESIEYKEEESYAHK